VVETQQRETGNQRSPTGDRTPTVRTSIQSRRAAERHDQRRLTATLYALDRSEKPPPFRCGRSGQAAWRLKTSLVVRGACGSPAVCGGGVARPPRAASRPLAFARGAGPPSPASFSVGLCAFLPFSSLCRRRPPPLRSARGLRPSASALPPAASLHRSRVAFALHPLCIRERPAYRPEIKTGKPGRTAVHKVGRRPCRPAWGCSFPGFGDFSRLS